MLKYIISVSKNSTELNEIHTKKCSEERDLSDVRILDIFNNSHDAKQYAEEIGFEKVYPCPHCCSDLLGF